MQKKYKTAIYMRISNSDSGDEIESGSISNQRKIIMDFLKNHDDIEVVSERFDDGFSGSNYDRPAFIEMMQDVANGEINSIVVKDLSRLGRDFVETGIYLRHIFPKMNVRFISIADNIDTKVDSDLKSKLDVSIKTLLNDEYLNEISQKTKKALEIKRKSGEFINNFTVYGYQKSEQNKNKLVVDEYASTIVKEIFDLKKNGYAAVKIANILNERGVLSPIEYKKLKGIPCAIGGFVTKEQNLWSATTIIRILKDEIYTGDLLQGKTTTLNHKLPKKIVKSKDEWIVVKNTHEAIILKEDFELVQRLMNIDTRTSPKLEKVHLFSGILVCGSCGNRMTRKTVYYKGKQYFYYHCTTGKKNGCTTKMIKESDLVECVSTSINLFIDNVLNFEETVDIIKVKQVNQLSYDKHIAYTDEIKGEIEQIFKYKSTLYENLINNVISKKDYERLKIDYDADIDRLQKARNTANDEFEKQQLNEDSVSRLKKYFYEYTSPEELSRRTVVELIKFITINTNEITINYTFQVLYEQMLKAMDKEVV